MQSPFFWRNLLVLLLVLANLVLSGRLLQQSGFLTGTPSTGVLLRSGAMAYATLSLLAALIGMLLFGILEVFSDSRTTWQRSARWGELRPGMTEAEVVGLLGEPFQRLSSNATSSGPELQFGYRLHPLGMADGAAVIFQPSPEGAMTLASKSPDDAGWARGREEWIPGGYTAARYRETIGEAASLLSFTGIMLLAILTLIPFGTPQGARSWALYLPLIALLLGVVYEARGPRGWRYDLMLLYPAYALILIGWLVRLIALVRARPG
jgi:hypothetical protein